jgi:hypothetical protein
MENKTQYMAYVNPSDSKVDLTYAFSILLGSGNDKKHFSAMALRPQTSKRRYSRRTDEIVESGIKKYRDGIIPKHVHEDLASGKCKKVILNYNSEGYHDIDWDYVSTILGVEKSKIIWLTSVWNPKHLDAQSEVTVVFGNFWERFVHGQIKQRYNSLTGLRQDCPIVQGYKQQIQDIKDLKIRKYHGLCYNRQPHDHRIYLLTKLKSEELLEQTAYSWGGPEMRLEGDGPGWDDKVKNMSITGIDEGYLKPRDDLSFREVVKLKQRTFPNEELGNRKLNNLGETNKAHSINFDHISTAYFQIISETHVDNTTPDPYLSEKSYKPFISGMPFVTWGNAFTIDALESQGYKCFKPWINQSYDNIMNDGERLHALIKETKRLYAIPPEQWSIMLKEMMPTIEHNFEQLNINCNEIYREYTRQTIDPRVIRFIV